MRPADFKLPVFEFKSKDFYKEQIEPYRATNEAKIAEKQRAQEALRVQLVSNTQTTLKPVTPAPVSSDRVYLLRLCESGNNYSNRNNSTYRGAYQYDFSTWANYGGYYDPADAPPEVQDAKFAETYARRGGSPWPVCSKRAGL